ncbi:hypothetical protein [Oceanicoccus sp. KOV_DT_Chl]|uniref:hypothetical protein n=1 Tax=Oceanicoccus sp. KOV_DT_Chl TaxID=1904639 RepID=UPI000C7E1DA5|nr:hypothetical protein [Oceanicoccus sp. KOV_DT_Chl]
MYRQYTLATTQQNTQNTVRRDTDHQRISLALLFLGTALACLLSSNTLADSGSNLHYQYINNINSSAAITSPQQRLLNRVLPAHLHSDLVVTNTDSENDLAFNYLWMEQYKADYRSSEGGNAAGKILRRGLKAWYKSKYGKASTLSGDDEDTMVIDTLSQIDYRLRVSGDKVKLGIKYEF